MEAYINSLACISHYNTASDEFFFEETPPAPGAQFLFVTAPNYKEYIPAATLRRTSHILKMGISAGLMCLQKSGAAQTDAIIVGTAMGCYEDTDKFLRAIDANGEKMLTPTSFIQSTHNTVAGQLALLVKCHGYNFTYVHQGLSFEYALADALLLLKEKEAETILLGGVDELIPPLCELFSRAGHIRKKEEFSEPVWKGGKGYIAGEGACFFNLSTAPTDKSLAKIQGVKTFQHIAHEHELLEQCDRFLQEAGLTRNDVSLVLSGINGDSTHDRLLNALDPLLGLPTAYFKALCGEYFTASGFALWLATRILEKQAIPASIQPAPEAPPAFRTILILNQFQGLYSMICLSRC